MANSSTLHTHTNNTHSHKCTCTYPSVACWWKWYFESLCANGAGLRLWITCVWQASHGRWGQTTTTTTNRRNPFCASAGADMRWVRPASSSFLPHGTITPICMLMCWNVHCASFVPLSHSVLLLLLVVRTIRCAVTSTPPWLFCPWRCLNSSSEWPISTSFSWWCCRSDENSPTRSFHVFVV